MGIYLVRAFVQLRNLIASNKALAQKLNELEHKLENHDDAIAAILSAIRQPRDPPTTKRRAIARSRRSREYAAVIQAGLLHQHGL